MPDNKLRKSYVEGVKNCGKIVAPLYYNFARFVQRRAKHPIKVSYRSAHPAKHALEHLGVACDELWLNRDVSLNMDKEIVREYCTEQGLDRPFTYVDNGYCGSIPENLRASPFCNFQPLYLTRGMHCPEHDIPSLLPTTKNGFCLDVVESIPQKYDVYDADDLTRGENGISLKTLLLSDVEQDMFNAFFDGMTEGYAFCNDDKKRFWNYMEVLERAHPLLKSLQSGIMFNTETTQKYSRQVEMVYGRTFVDILR